MKLCLVHYLVLYTLEKILIKYIIDYYKEKNFSDQVAHEIDAEVRAIINQCFTDASKIIKDNIKLLDNIANYLLEIETLTKSDIDEIVKSGKLSWWEKQKKQEQKTNEN